jgi:hypothetical protein
LKHDQVAAVEAGVDVLQVSQRADEQPGADEQDERQRCARTRSRISSENDVLELRPVTGSIDPMFSPARDMRPFTPSTARNRTSSSGFLTGSTRRRKSLTRLKIAVFAPTPRARETTATAVKPGLTRSSRTAWRTSRQSVFNTPR